MAWGPAQSQYLADLLTGLGTGFLSRDRNGPPLAGLGAGINNAQQLMAMRRQQADQDQERQWRAAQIARQQKLDAETDAAKARSASGLSRLLGQPDPNATPKFVGGAGSGSSSFQQPVATTAAPAWATPDIAAILQGMDPSQALGVAAQLATQKPDQPELTEFSTPDGRAYKGYLDPQTKQPVRVGDFYPRWQPPQPKGPSEMKQRALEAGLVPGTPEYRNFMLTGGAQPKTREILTLYGPNGAMKSVYADDAGVPALLSSGWTAAAPKQAEQPGIVTLYDQRGGTKAFYQGDPQIAGLLDQGWTDKAPAEQKMPGLISLTKGDQTITINENDPQRGMYLGSGWIESGAAPKPEKLTELQQRAKDSGLVEGTPEYQQFMKTNGKVPEGPGGAFGGTALDAQDSNIILKGQQDPVFRDSDEFRLAWYRQYQQPKIITTPDPADPTRLIQQTMLIPPPPGFAGPPARGASTAPAPQAAAPSPQSAPPQPSQPAAPSAPAVPGQPVVTPIPGTSKADPADARKMKQIRSEVAGVKASLNDFKAVVKKASMPDFLNASITGGTSEGGAALVSAWTVAAMQAKAESLFNLGVLNGPDMSVISGALQNPATLKGTIASKDAYVKGIDTVLKLIDDKVAAFEQQYGDKTGPASSTPPGLSVFDKFGLTPPPQGANP